MKQAAFVYDVFLGNEVFCELSHQNIIVSFSLTMIVSPAFSGFGHLHCLELQGPENLIGLLASHHINEGITLDLSIFKVQLCDPSKTSKLLNLFCPLIGTKGELWWRVELGHFAN